MTTLKDKHSVKPWTQRQDNLIQRQILIDIWPDNIEYPNDIIISFHFLLCLMVDWKRRKFYVSGCSVERCVVWADPCGSPRPGLSFVLAATDCNLAHVICTSPQVTHPSFTMLYPGLWQPERSGLVSRALTEVPDCSTSFIFIPIFFPSSVAIFWSPASSLPLGEGGTNPTTSWWGQYHDSLLLSFLFLLFFKVLAQLSFYISSEMNYLVIMCEQVCTVVYTCVQCTSVYSGV